MWIYSCPLIKKVLCACSLKPHLILLQRKVLKAWTNSSNQLNFLQITSYLKVSITTNGPTTSYGAPAGSPGMCPACWSARRAAGDCGGVTHTPNRCHTSEENTLYCHNHTEEWPTYQAADGKILDGENKRTRSGLDFNHVRDGMKHSETNMSSPSQEVTEFKYPEAKYLNAQSVGGSET